ncbi:MAG TPA: hypothetical protein VJZ76_02220 [Thermoanaerobaculia bacterium]|nr:hypothetical protein [Thermoanaerobaculia bacterium]
MRPWPARLLLSGVVIASVAAGIVTPLFFLAAVPAAALLITSLTATRSPLIRTLDGFRGREVNVLLWGAPPPMVDAPLVVTSVNVIGPGIHVFFASASGKAMHLKIAQPKRVELSDHTVVVRDARYVQWNVSKIARSGRAAAVAIALRDSLAAPR